MGDLRNSVAKARDAWLDTDVGSACVDGAASGQYLRNRIERAFIAGWHACEDYQITSILKPPQPTEPKP